MTSAVVSRLIKEELLNSAYPEIYQRTDRPIRKVAPKKLRKIKLDVKVEGPKVKKKRRNQEELNYDEEVEFLRSSAPRRPYQWRGRRVKRVLRPGTVVHFTPGVRSGTRQKRSYDEVMGDSDIMLQASENLNEFAYGKRRRIAPYEPPAEAMILDNRNSTPSLQPITPQVPLPIAGVKRERPGDLQPTIQLMVKRARNHHSYPAPEDIKPLPQLPIKDEEMLDVGPSSLFDVPLPPSPTKMEIEDIKIRPVKKVTEDVGVQTVDIEVPVPSKRAVKRRPKLPQGVWYHPSIDINAPKVVRTRRRRTPKPPKTWIAPTVTRKGAKLPKVLYHPTIV